MNRYPSQPIEAEIAGSVDDLDQARVLLDALNDAESDDQGVSYSLKAIAHVMLWHAEQMRNWQLQQARAAQAAEEWRAAQPIPPPPPFPTVYPGGAF